MQKCGFSETQFSFNYTNEFVQAKSITNLPFFPDTVNEGRYYGFDVCVGNYFLQYKKSNLFDINDPQPRFYNAFNSNYFKIKIKADKRQFQFLKKISRLNQNFNKVMYVTPEFHTRRELKRRFASHSIIDGSAHFSLNDFPDNLTGDHYLIYNDKDNSGTLFSEPRRIKKSNPNLDVEENHNNRLSLFKMAEKIMREVDRSEHYNQIQDYRNQPGEFVRQVRGLLMNEYQSLWLPVINWNEFERHV
ncbi:hypothetical protein KFE98_16900 [bacterium SCSIO 12741]|nr:hypothetical protein KFE98_16900 [bacterium SCSIO 12741]